MKKLFNIYDKDEEENYKKRLMKFTLLPVEYITFHEMKYNGTEDEFIHVTVVDDPNFHNKDVLVLFHGLTGSSIVFYKMYQKLATNYKIIGIDLPGMGCSSRNPIKFVDYQSTSNYFSDRIKAILDTLKIDKFTLLGHSFGGYIAGLYCIKYPESVNKIIFLSPVGVGYEVACISTNPLEDAVHKFLYKLNGPPTIGYKFFGFFANLCFDILMESKCKNMTLKGESDTFKEFMNCLFRNTCASEKAVFQFFDANLRAFNPLINHYKKFLDKKVIFLYGDNDWSPRSHAETFKEFVPHSKIEIVSDSGHLLYSDNVDSLCEKILEFEYETQELESISTDFVSESSEK